MPTQPLNPVQQLVVKHYAGGQYRNHECHIPGDTGDTLFDFVMSEAGSDCLAEAIDFGVDAKLVLLGRVMTAMLQLTRFQSALLKEIQA